MKSTVTETMLSERVDGLSGSLERRYQRFTLFKELKQFESEFSRTHTPWRTKAFKTCLSKQKYELACRTFFMISHYACAVVLAGLAYIASKQWWTVPIAFAGGGILPLSYIRMKCRLRLRRLGLQLPEAFDAIGRAVRAGQKTISAAFQIVSDEFEAPISEEFRRCYEQQNLGMPYQSALRNMASRTGIMELRIFVVALLTQSRSGGDLIELLGNLSMLVRMRIKLQQRVRALTAEQRMQASVLIVLPLVAFAVIRVLSPHYDSSLLDRPWLLGMALASQLTGALWIRTIINATY